MNTPLLGPEMRTMRRELAAAPDAQVLAVLRLVDAMPDRGHADSLLAPLRDRLRVLRPVRPLRFTRLLFMPLDPVIVPPNQWRLEQPLLPRSAILPLTSLIRHALPAQTEAVELGIAHQKDTDRAAIARMGEMLWPAAAPVLLGATAPPQWQQAGLRPADFSALAQAAAAVLAAAPHLRALEDASLGPGDLNAALSQLLEEAARAGPLGWGMLLTILLERFPQADAPRNAAVLPRTDKGLRMVAEAAQAQSLRWVEQATNISGLGDLHDAADAAHRQVTLLEKYHTDPAHRRRATELAAALRVCLTAQLEAGVQLRMVEPLSSLPTGLAANVILDRLEDDARALRRLELELRRLGGQAAQAQLRRAADAMMAHTELSPMDRARLVEILLGAQDAVALLKPPGRVSQSGSGR
jgi:hypothetical protein